MLQNLAYSSESSGKFATWAISSSEFDTFAQARAVNASIMAAAAVALAGASVSAVSPASVDYAAVKAPPSAKQYDSKAAIFDQILKLTELPQHWDGWGESVAPSKSAANDAINFFEKIPPFLTSPEVIVASDGELGLFWTNNDLYRNVSFFGDGRMVYFGKMDDIEIKGSFLSSTSHGMPSNLAKFMSKIS
jgi:hypothetical protein